MKKKTTVLLILLALSVFAAYGFVNCASAKVSQWETLYFPSEPNLNPPSIEVYTPIQNATYNTTDLSTILNLPLNVTITKQNYARQAITSAWYTINNGPHESRVYFNFNDNDNPYSNNKVFKNTSLLQLGCGVHTLKIGLEAKSYYIDDKQEIASVTINTETNPITFTITPTPTPTPTPTATPSSQTLDQPVIGPIGYVLLACFAVAAVVAPILLYIKHKHHGQA
jgi:hypothetical protein